MRKPSLCTQNTSLHITVAAYTYGVNFIRLPKLITELFKFKNQKCDQILCAYKPYFLMPGHIYSHQKLW